jgi:hypothetical protein
MIKKRVRFAKRTNQKYRLYVHYIIIIMMMVFFGGGIEELKT